MVEELELDITALLPNFQSEQDQCLARLQDALASKRGVSRVHFHTDRDPLQLCLHYDSDLVSLDQVRRIAGHAGMAVTNRYHHDLFEVEGLDCGDCALVIEHGLSRLDGVLAASVSYPTATLRVEYDIQKTNRSAVLARVRDLGYSVNGGNVPHSWLRENRELVLALLSGGLLAVGFVLERWGWLAPLPSLVYALVYVTGGFDLTRHALKALRRLEFDIDVLMMFAALGAALLGDLGEGALLLFLFSLGHALEHYALRRAHNAIHSLAKLSPKSARVKRQDREIELPVEQLQRGDTVIVRAGERLPVDGTVVKGQSAVDQSPITGESAPAEKGPGDAVFAGTVNGQGAIEIAITKLSRDTTLARVLQMVEEAQTQKSPTQRLTAKFESVFVPVVLALDVALIVVPPLVGIASLQDSFYRAMALLIAASPCALAIGTPAAIVSAIAQAARSGVLVKGGTHLETLGVLDAIAFDKTGTLTRGEHQVNEIVPTAAAGLPSDTNQASDYLLALAAAVESRSTHPLAHAVVKAAQSRRMTLPALDEVQSVPGQGLRATLDGEPLLVGTLRFFESENIPVDDSVRQQIRGLEGRGQTTMLVARNRDVLGIIALADTPRAEAAQTVARLYALGMRRTIMLTGDNEQVAAATAQQVRVGEYRANLLPEDKLQAIRELSARYGAVAMVGDGINDAPALAHAAVGIAMGGAGTDVALESADVVLMADDLSRLPFVVGLSRATRAVIRQNLALALGVIALLIVSSVAGLVSLGIAILLHEGSTLAVVFNSLRLLRFRGESKIRVTSAHA